MIFTKAEIDLLRLTAWCKDLPADIPEILTDKAIQTLSVLGLIRQSKCKLSYRLTAQGNLLLQKAGFDYPADKQYLGYGRHFCGESVRQKQFASYGAWARMYFGKARMQRKM